MGAITFITATGTDAGKTYVTCALASALVKRGLRVAAIKPIETGCHPDPLDAIELGAACGHPELAQHPGFYRVRPALSPHAVTLTDGTPPPDLDELARHIHAFTRDYDHVLVEGAGGLLVPIDAHRTLANLAQKLAAPLLLVAPDRLGTLSHVLTAHQSAEQHDLVVSCVILSQSSVDPSDPSPATNAQILGARLPIPIFRLPPSPGPDVTAIANLIQGQA